MTPDLQERLKTAIRRAIEEKGRPFTGPDIAAAVKRDDPKLWEEAREVIATEKLIAMATGTLRGPLHGPNSAQLNLPGFENLPRYIRAGAKWVNLKDANQNELNEFAKWYRVRLEQNVQRLNRDRVILHEVERLARLVTIYSRKTPGITVSEVIEIREHRKVRFDKVEPIN